MLWSTKCPATGKLEPPAKALMKHRINMFDIYLPSQHLVFVFDAPKWLLMRPRVCASFLFWNEEMNEGCLSSSVSTLQRVSGRPCFPAAVLSGNGRALNLIITLYACFHPNVSTGITTLITFGWFLNVVAKHSPGMSVQFLFFFFTHACVCSSEKRSLSSQARAQQQFNHKYLSWRGRSRETESERLSATAGSKITNSIVLGWVTCLLSNFLLATSEGRKVWRKRGELGGRHPRFQCH